jgi:hypothetical protein
VIASQEGVRRRACAGWRAQESGRRPEFADRPDFLSSGLPQAFLLRLQPSCHRPSC